MPLKFQITSKFTHELSKMLKSLEGMKKSIHISEEKKSRNFGYVYLLHIIYKRNIAHKTK